MKVGERRSASVDARQLWSVTDIVLKRGGTYLFDAAGEWWDARIRCDADGRALDGLTVWQWLILKAFAWLRRVPHETWFVLIGALDCDMGMVFRIGTGGAITMAAGGTMTRFANDVASKYDKNFGVLTLTVTRVA